MAPSSSLSSDFCVKRRASSLVSAPTFEITEGQALHISCEPDAEIVAVVLTFASSSGLRESQVNPVLR